MRSRRYPCCFSAPSRAGATCGSIRGWHLRDTVILLGLGVSLTIGMAWTQRLEPIYATSVEIPATSETGFVTLYDDRQSAMFDVSDLKPGDRHSQDMTVTYTGTSAPAAVVLYASTDNVTGNGLERYLHLTVEIGDVSGEGGDGTFTTPALFSGTLDAFGAFHTSYVDGIEWIVGESGESRTFRFTITLLDDDRAQGLEMTVAFTWESQVW